MDHPQSDDAAQAVFRVLGDAEGAEGGDAEPPDDAVAVRADSAAGHDLVDDLRRQAEALLDDADKLGTAWLEEAEMAREEALELHRQAEADLAEARARAQRERDAVIEEAIAQVRAEADLLMQEARENAVEVLGKAEAEGRANVEAESARLLDEAQRRAVEIIEQATAEGERIVAEAHREEARVLLDARARVDEVRSRLIRLYQEMEAAAAARWKQTGARTSHSALEKGGHASAGVEQS